MPENSPKLPIKEGLAAAGLMGIAAMTGGQTDMPEPQPAEAAHVTEAPESADLSAPLRLPDGSRIILPDINREPIAIGGPKPEESTELPVESVSVDQAAEIARTFVEPPVEPPRQTEVVSPPVTTAPIPPPPPEVIKPTPTPPETLRAIEFASEVPAEVAELLKEDTLYMNGNGCSGAVIENAQKVAVGALLASHCLKRESMQVGSDGKTYLPMGSIPQAQVGDQFGQLETIGEIGSFIVPNDPKDEKDIAIAPFKDQNPREVLDAYTANALTPEEIRNLKPGDVLYMSGWPTDQEAHPGTMVRTDFALTVIGVGPHPGLEGDLPPLLWLGVKKNQDGARCTPGSSGSRISFVDMSSGQPSLRSAGTLSRYLEFDISQPHSSGADYYKAAAEAQFGIEIPEDVTAMCGAYFEVPPADQQIEVHPVATIDEIPGYGETYGETAIAQRAREYFLDPAATKYYIDGKVTVGGGVGEDGEPVESVIDRPMFYYDKVSETWTIAGRNDYQPDSIEVFQYKRHWDLNIEDRDDTPGVEVLPFTGTLAPKEEAFATEQGDKIGIPVAVKNPSGSLPEDPYRIWIDEQGVPHASPASESKG